MVSKQMNGTGLAIQAATESLEDRVDPGERSTESLDCGDIPGAVTITRRFGHLRTGFDSRRGQYLNSLFEKLPRVLPGQRPAADSELFGPEHSPLVDQIELDLER